MVVYMDSEQQLDPTLKKGFNLVKLTEAGSTVVPQTTPISLSLSGGPMLDVFVCEGAWANDGTMPENLCGLDFSQVDPGQE